MRWLPLLALALSAPSLAQPAQRGRLDVLTGEPRRVTPRPDPIILNAPHAPRQQQQPPDLPIAVEVAPPLGDTGGALTRRRW